MFDRCLSRLLTHLRRFQALVAPSYAQRIAELEGLLAAAEREADTLREKLRDVKERHRNQASTIVDLYQRIYRQEAELAQCVRRDPRTGRIVSRKVPA
jgi:predicted  nucleic acid-binding Zn-ribbon protein